LDENSTTCGKCTGTNYFLHKGGCYLQTATPGQTICQAAGSDGTCTTCSGANGYFRNPGAAATVDSCISCGDTTGVTVGNGDSAKTYKGVDGCKTCTLSNSATIATCTECATGFLHTPTGSTSCVAECPKGYFGHTASNTQKKTCQSCATANSLNPSVTGIPGCASCTYTGGDTSVLTCSECENGKKPSLDGLHCYDCTVGNCASCNSGGACQKCISGYILDGDACTQQTCSTPDCKTCTNPKTANEACTACVSNYYLTPTSQCIADCAILSGYYGDADKTCKRCGVANCEACNAQGQCQACINGFHKDSAGACQKCHESCRACSGEGATKCTACPAGKILKYSGAEGQCIEQCVVNAAAESGNCKTCGLTVEGTAYCSVCAMDSEYPQNGVCSSATARTAATCKVGQVSSGACTSCNNGFFLMEGGCYETDRYPGKSVCTEAAQTGGTCQTAAPGYKVENGNLVTCSEGCKTCSAADACTDCVDGYVKIGSACSKCDASCLTCETEATKCKECASGYYKTASGSTCTSCESNSGGITGVKGCASCAAPTGSTGPVLCYLVKGGTAGLISSRTCGHLCMATRVTRIASSLLGVSHGDRAPPRQ
ncbi:Variant-specific surface protein, partial [Giardia duodenalis]